jgi:Secretion system C-terminal sorting domain
MKKIILLFFLCCCLIGRIQAQSCGTSEPTESEFKALPYYGNNAFLQHYVDSLTTVFNNPANRVEGRAEGVWYRVPIQFWIYTWNGQNSLNLTNIETDKTLKAMMWHLNDAMQRNQIPIRFYMLCPRFFADERATIGETNFQYLTAISTVNKNPQALNCHILNNIPFASGMWHPTTNAIFVDRFFTTNTIASYGEGNGGENGTFVHEVGHWLGLNHTHAYDGFPCLKEPVNRGIFSSFCTLGVPIRQCEFRGDGLCDTPADPNLSKHRNDINNCNWMINLRDDRGDFYLPDTRNYMSYNADVCLNRFTPQQRAVMLLGIRIQQDRLGNNFDVNQNNNFDTYEPDNVAPMASLLRFNEPQIHSFSEVGSCEDDDDWVKFIYPQNEVSLEEMILELENVDGYNNPVSEIEFWNGGVGLTVAPTLLNRGDYAQIVNTPTKITYVIPCNIATNRTYLFRIVRNGNQTGRYKITLKRKNPSIQGNDVICGNTSFNMLEIPTGANVFWNTSANISPRSGGGNIANITPTMGGDAWITFTVISCGNQRVFRKNFYSGLPVYSSITVSGSLVSIDGASFQTFPEGNHTLQISANNSVIVRRTRYVGTTASPTQTCGSPCTFTLRRGEYQVFSIQSTNSCGTAYATVIVAAPNVTPTILARVANTSSIEEKPLKIYPNPVAQELFIENAANHQEIALYDKFGKKIWEWNKKGEGVIQVSTQKIPNGVYFLHMTDEQGNTQKQQIIINK